MTFYYTNQQSARLMFYHDHAWGTTRLNVYAGEAAGYLITDDKEKELVTTGTIPADQIPLVVQDRTFVPAGRAAVRRRGTPQGNITSYGQDPTWDKARWGGYGNFWYHHVYMPAQNPGDPGGMSAYGRWMYGPWFWPPAAATTYGPIANPYYDPACDLNDPDTWTYQTDPFCEPQQIPGTPNISAGMEQFNDTPIVNGVAYPEVTLQPKTLPLPRAQRGQRPLLQLPVVRRRPDHGHRQRGRARPAAAGAGADSTRSSSRRRCTTPATDGPDWIQIGTEGGFLPAPVVVDGQQETTWITDPTRFDVGNVDMHSLLLAPAERADVIVDFSKFAGKTLILYNDAPAAFPARVPSYDYYTGTPDLSPNGAPAHPARLRPQHAHHHARQDRRSRSGRGLQPHQAAHRLQPQDRRLGRLREQPAPDHRRPGRLQLGLRHQLLHRQRLQRRRHHAADLRRLRARQRHGAVRLQHAQEADHQDHAAAAAQGHPRRDERHHLRRVRPHAGQPRRRGAAADAGPAERHALPVRQPGDGDHQRHQPAEEQRDLRRQRQPGERRQDRADQHARTTARRSGA